MVRGLRARPLRSRPRGPLGGSRRYAGGWGLAEHRRDDGDVGQVRAAVVRVVERVDVARLHPAGVACHHRLDRLAHRAQVHRHVGRVGDEVAAGVEQRAREVEALLDVDRVRGVLQLQAHLLGDVHERVVEHLQHHRIDAGADGHAARARRDALQHQVVQPGHARLPAGLDDGGGVLLRDDGRAVDEMAGAQRLAHHERGVPPAALAVHAHGLGDRRRHGRADRDARFGRRVARGDRLDRHGFDDQAAAFHQEGIPATVCGLEGGGERRDAAVAEVDDQRRVGSRVAHVRAAHHADLARARALATDLAGRLVGQRGEPRVDRRQRGFGQRLFDRRLAHHALVGQAHAVGRQHARQRMHEHRRHAQRIGHQARVLAAGAAEALQRVARDVVAAGHRDLLDRVGHARDGDVDEALCQFLGRARAAGGRRDVGGHPVERVDDRVAIERLVRRLAEHLREPLRLDLAQQHVRIGDGQRAAAPVARRPGIRARAVRPGAQPRAVEAEDRAAARGHGVDAHHRRAHAHAGHLRLERALELAGEVRHVGRRTAHVEADDVAEVGQLRRAHHADDAAGRAGQDRVLALERVRVGQAARRLHEEQLHAGHLARHLFDVAAQDGREVGIDDGGVAAADQLHQRTRPVRRAHLREADLARQLRRRRLVLREPVAVHEHDRHAAQAGVERALQVGAQRRVVERLQHVAVRAHALVGLDHLRVQQLGQADVAVEQTRAILVGDAQRVAEAARGHEQRLLALAFQQRVRGDRRAHLDALDERRRDRLAGLQSEQVADAGDRGVAILLGVLRQQLVRDEAAVRALGDDVGEGAAAVDPELPARWRERGWGGHRRHPFESVTNILPGACVMHSAMPLRCATHCAVTPQPQNTGTSSSRISTASP